MRNKFQVVAAQSGEKKAAGTPENVFEITAKGKIRLIGAHLLRFF